MKSIAKLVGVVTIAVAGYVNATTLPRIALEELFRDADAVVIGTVVSGELIGSGAEGCGAKYLAKVEESFKGPPKGSTIEFGNFHGYELGGRYVLFLVAPGRRHEPWNSTNSIHLQAKAEFEARCGGKLDRHTVMHSGYGTLVIDWTSKFRDKYEYKDGVRVPTRFVELPKSVETVAATPSEKEEYSDVVWVRLEEMVKTLRKLAK